MGGKAYSIAILYEVETRILVRAVKRNEDRFPTDFMFQLEDREVVALR
ncbi:ORF6N domain-containing protein, partial [bacterium]|nr:ORF6N domain-containing protein [bacterium]